MSKSKLMMPVPALKTLNELEETPNENSDSNQMLEPNNKLFKDSKSKPPLSTARSSSSIITIGNTTNIKQKLKQNQKTSSRKPSFCDSADESAISENSNTKNEKQKKLGLDYDKLVPNQCDCDLIQLKYINPYEKYLITRIFSSVGNLSSYVSDLNQNNLKYYLNTPDQNEFLPLYYAIKANNITAVKYLITIGAGLNRTSSLGDPAPHLACLVGCSTELVDYLLNCLQVDSFQNGKNETSALYKQDQEGWTVLHCACNQGNLNIVKHLIEKKFININIKDSKKNYTGLQLAIANNRLDIVDYFLTYEPMSFVKKNQVETIFNTNIHRAPKSAVNKPKIELPIEIMKRRSSSAVTNSTSDKQRRSIISIDLKIKKEKSLNSSQKQQQNSQRVSNEIVTTEAIEAPKVKLIRPKTCVEPISFYPIVDTFRVESIQFYNNQILDLNSLNNDGHNVLHLGCKFGRFEIVNILLKKYGSNSLDINMLDFKGKTCMDLAWNWLVNIKNSNFTDKNFNKIFKNKSSLYLVQEKMLDLNTHLENEIQLIGLLNQYGAKFSSYQILFHDYYINSSNTTDINLNNLISNYLKCILYLFKLNVPTLFLNSNNNLNKNLNQSIHFLRDNITSLSTSSGSMSGSSSFLIVSNHSFNLMNLKQTTESFNECFKRDLKQTLNELNDLIQIKFEETLFERSVFLENIQIALDYLSRF